jgi:hypothetical protein
LPVKFGREESRRRFRDAVGSPQLRVLENGIFFVCYQSGAAGGFDEHLAPLLNIAARDKTLVILKF